MTKHEHTELDQWLLAELIPAAGCTEPIAVALAAAMARATLGCRPDSLSVGASGSLLKNVKSVVVPNTGGGRGMAMALAAGVVAGDETRGLEVLVGIAPNDIPSIHAYAESVSLDIHPLTDGPVFDLRVEVRGGGSTASVRLAKSHTRVVRVEKNGVALIDHPLTEEDEKPTASAAPPRLSMELIWDYIAAPLTPAVRDALLLQSRRNMAIAEEGLRGTYGANIGRVILNSYGDSPRTRLQAWTAAGVDARMAGCEWPVIINSGSGNQGIVIAVPVTLTAREQNADDDTLCRALALANATAIHVKEGVGRLSAFCGVVGAAAGAAAGMAWLLDKDYSRVIHAVVNTLATVSGMVCDGAKASCAAKAALAIDAAFLAFNMGLHGKEFRGGEGIVTRGVEATIANIARLARDGMRSTNEEIIRIMTGC